MKFKIRELKKDLNNNELAEKYTKEDFFWRGYSKWVTIVIAIIFVVVSFSLVFSTFISNSAVLDARSKVLDFLSASCSSPNKDDLNSIIDYLDKIQSVYNEIDIFKIMSLLYAVLSTAILSYAARLVRLPSEERKEIAKQISEDAQKDIKALTDEMSQIIVCGKFDRLLDNALFEMQIYCSIINKLKKTDKVSDGELELISRSYIRLIDGFDSINNFDGWNKIKVSEENMSKLHDTSTAMQKYNDLLLKNDYLSDKRRIVDVEVIGRGVSFLSQKFDELKNTPDK
jgi:hypothetical protein